MNLGRTDYVRRGYLPHAVRHHHRHCGIIGVDPAHRWQFPLEEETQGRAAGVRDAVGQDRARLRLAMAILIAEINGILKGSEHECSPAGELAADLPDADRLCWACLVIRFSGDAAIADYHQVQRRVADILETAASGGPTE